jgi:hypothetical protein
LAPRPPEATRRGRASFTFPVVRVPAIPLPGYPSFRLGLPSRRVRAALIRHQAEVVHLAFTAAVARLGADPAACAALRRAPKGTAWLIRRSRDLVPALVGLAVRECLGTSQQDQERDDAERGPANLNVFSRPSGNLRLNGG